MRDARTEHRPRCPCCGSDRDGPVLAMIPYRRIWERLEEEWGVCFPPDVVERNTPAERTRLIGCRECGLQFFLPAIGGDREFYRDLGASPAYYAPWKWEFGWVMERVPPARAVLDVGCGSGNFLARIAPLARRAVGMEQNPAAAAAARAKGLEVFEGDVEDFSRAEPGAFDAACAFHVLEHLPEPADFLRRLVRCLRPGGSVFVSMPNRLRTGKGTFESLDCPPHHLSRWSPAQLRTLGEVAGLTLAERACEPVDIAVPRERLRARVEAAAKRMPVAGEFVGFWAARAITRLMFARFLSAIHRKTGVLERMGYYGLSMVARYVVTRKR